MLRTAKIPRCAPHIWSRNPNARRSQWLGITMGVAPQSLAQLGEEGLLLQTDTDEAKIVHAGTGEKLRQGQQSAYLETANGRVARVAATAHLPAPSNRAAHQRVDFTASQG